ncbi:CRAL/TRIO, amine-terminal domain protein (macronuclear) [Tetrahymena thermophila SB210]|uniref:CRAL/TRIO, amine-terminal domain protein n=1 Tax=Tetrahymena thermophila (strain SB210) TaxID=312017 RepID=I7M251_TETTS|nr:CRAL/TRIO, amine-terminal domain protein [Tetrahymena thermophila SB210]EAR98487.2 CRAL/TRIO, amine-terminal domain protein [Tetrahymena thermophila SB210]|eukprot:XP_001018732.2 CRAL/TRIO, amine-terminal domain protein [Tetrahymena thermophila SB210]
MDNNKNSGNVGECSQEQLDTLQKFRQFTAMKGCSEKEYDDHYLLRFLRARKFDLVKTEKMFSDFLDWRIKNDVQNIMKFSFNELAEVRHHYPHGYHKTDKLGRPIYIERIGMLKLTQLFQVTTEERLIKYYIQSYEILLNRIFPTCSQAIGHRVDQTVTILDLKGIPMKMLSKQVYNFIQLASKVAQENYPEILGRMFIVNAPMLFSGVWAVIKPWIDEKTRNKITIIGSGFKEKLLEIIDIDNIPDFLGGNSKCDLSKNIGPWNPTGETPLFPCEYKDGMKQDGEEEKVVQDGEEDEDSEAERQAMELAALRDALAGKITGPSSKAPHNPDKYELTTQGAKFQVSDTPLNTQAEADDDN